MRIIGGYLKGHSILPPNKYNARPTTDFAKVGLFNILMNEIDFDNCTFLDLFSGTGSISYEFASRGCSDIISIEMNNNNYRFIKSTVKELHIEGMQVLRQNVFDFINICKKSFDVIFADPPYAIENLQSIPDKVLCNSINLLKSNGLFILEHSSEFSFENHKYFIKAKKYGNVHFSFFKII